MAVGRAEERLDGPVLRLPLRVDRQGREGDSRGEILAQRAREVRHRLVAGGAARSPVPHLSRAIRRLAALAQGRLEELQVHPTKVAGDSVASKAVIDLRSDTMTRPTAAMREAIANAEV